MADNGVRKKKSKLEKIAELESSLKLSKEENRRLKKEVHLLKSVGGNAPSSPRKVSSDSPFFAAAGGSQEELDKMKDALKALKRVTINQEMSLQSLRAKASQRRQELEARDNTLGKMKRHIAHLKRQLAQANSDGGSAGGSNSNLQEQCSQLQDSLMEREEQMTDLQERLTNSQAKVRTLEKQLDRKRGPFQRENSQNSMKSYESSGDMASVSTAQEFDLTKLKKEIAKKSSKIVDLEYQLELVKDQLHEMSSAQKSNSNFVDFGGGDNPFGMDDFSKQQQQHEDDFYDSDHNGAGGEEDDEW
eukprot:CAMPEP_0172448174 /NCGR_PEP_ID=MMETSP1065-20121228/7241_1 /TAXON_ID=265537 /ORGANISM="Amphiprora paludosa, Strain CCMP125" /LENGTH=302 /DNA_ID=CAMNT_0013199589 /DNA_START=135 /DNA_END=1040 /DNA_ORIENTATION=-